MEVGDKLAHIIPTHERPGVCQRLVNSIHEKYPSHSIYVCDDSDEPCRYEHAINIKSPAYDIGLSAKRNILVQESEEPYIFLWDDDYMVTEDTDLELFWELFHKLPEVGVLGGEWVLGNGKREVWFTGDFWVKGPIQKHKPPEDIYFVDSEKYGTIRYHEVMFTPNWFLADRRTIESIYWDEELKLQEHTEFFARMAAARAKRNDDWKEHDKKWLDRYESRQFGDDSVAVDKNGRVEVYTMATFRNSAKLSHYGGMVSRGQWIKVDKDYAEELMQNGLVYSRKEMESARPFPVPNIHKDVPLGVALTPDTTCYHLRWDDTSRNDIYDESRDRDNFWPLQRQKLGTVNIQFGQWNSYGYDEIDFLSPEQIDWSLPNNYESYG